MKFDRLPQDILNRKEFTQMSKSELIKLTKQSIQKLNRRIASLEKSGLADYSKSLTRIRTYLKEELGTTRFSSKHLMNASFNERVDFLVRLKHFEKYKLTRKDVETQIKQELETIHSRSELSLNSEQLLTLNKAMEKYREKSGTSEISNYIDSDAIRQFFSDHVDGLNQTEIEYFLDDLEEYINSGGPVYVKDFVDYYNPTYRAPVLTTANGIPYNFVTEKMLDEYGNETEYTIDPVTEALYSDNGVQYRINEFGEIIEVK